MKKQNCDLPSVSNASPQRVWNSTSDCYPTVLNWTADNTAGSIPNGVEVLEVVLHRRTVSELVVSEYYSWNFQKLDSAFFKT